MKKLSAMKWLLCFICFSGACTGQCSAQLLTTEPPEKSAAEQAMQAVIRMPSLKTREFINPRLALTAERYLKSLDDGIGHHIWIAQLDSEEQKILVQELRRRYPAISIEKRLERINNPRRIEEVSKLHSDESAKPVEIVENQSEEEVQMRLAMNRYFSERRKSALSELHSASVSDFIAADDFGVSRVPQISPRDLKYRDPGPIALKTQSGTSTLYSSEKLVELPSQPKEPGSDSSSPFPKNQSPTASFTNHQMPFMETVTGLNDSAQRQFLSPDRIGVTSKDGKELKLETSIGPQEVIGFEGHGVDQLYHPDLGVVVSAHNSPNQHPHEKMWNLNRLELVSLLMNDEFMVYVSENLPRMEDLKEVPTRKVDSFELTGLSKLFKGEEVVVESTTNRIRMLGALRASKSCLECHSVKEGELLGALSYELIRQVPIEEK